MNQILKNKIKSLILKGFNKEEIKLMLKIQPEHLPLLDEMFEAPSNLNQDSVDLYSELQKDLSRLVFVETNNEKKDPAVILNAIKLQAELQEKKIILNKTKNQNFSKEKISKDYLYKRDEEIAELKKQGLSNEEIGKQFGVSAMTVYWALDRYELNIPEELKMLSPSIINETKGLPKDKRIELLIKAKQENINKSQMRQLVNNIKNTIR